MTKSAFKEKALAFAKSSGYRHGDRTSFAVRLNEETTLIGSCSAEKYLDDLGLKTLPARVMVVCPGNGGLIAECYRRGAKYVVAVEPRARFRAPLQRVLELLSEAWRLDDVQDLSHRVETAWPLLDRERGYKDFDLILWPEGVEEITTPKAIFQGLADCMNPGAKLFVEITLGRHNWVDRINSWRPRGEAVKAMAQEIFDGGPDSTAPGRNALSRVYGLSLPGSPVTKKQTKETAKKPPAAAAKTVKKTTKKKATKKKTTKKKATKKVTKKAPAKPKASDEPVVILDDEAGKPEETKSVEAPKPVTPPAPEEPPTLEA